MHLTTIQLADLATALEDHSGMTWYWDRDTGELLPVSEAMSWEELGLEEDPDENPDRFLGIDPIDARDSFRCMERYVESLAEGECRRSLFRALRGPRPFAVFKATLRDFPDEREAWFTFHGVWLQREVRDFARLHGLGEVQDEAEA